MKVLLAVTILLQIHFSLSRIVNQFENRVLSVMSNKPQMNSPYELWAVNDLMLEITQLNCPAVSRPEIKSMKQFFVDIISKAQEQMFMSQPFMKNYAKMVECTTYFENKHTKKSLVANERIRDEKETAAAAVKITSVKKEFPSDNLDFWIKFVNKISDSTYEITDVNIGASDSTYEITDLNIGSSDSKEDDYGSDEFHLRSRGPQNLPRNTQTNDEFNLQVKGPENLSPMFYRLVSRNKREVSANDDDTFNYIENNGNNFKDESSNLFVELLSHMLEIVAQSCPSQFKPDKDFMAASTSETLSLMSQNSGATQGAQKYKGVLKEVAKCRIQMKMKNEDQQAAERANLVKAFMASLIPINI